ncbi:hypothetical protein GCM10025876_08900 [Demequina litorisediminis]|uniref:Voltage gated chloride channel n=1 Tax=Demequina litorisediminis TaxID=1849022 RepID=A0ABQ6IB59_9MICO|nr:hypothetical protein GCM10025876_08900 [Demequina litorisediminis]
MLGPMSDATLTHDERNPAKARTLLKITVPAIAVGAMCAVVLWAIDVAAEGVTHVMWDWIPEVAGFDAEAWWWPIIVLGLAGTAVGTIVRHAPGHAGYDSATTELVAPPLPLKALPGIAAALIVSLGAGVSLGPESPIISIAVGLSVWGLARILPNAQAGQILLVAGAGMLGAMFGSPVAAALLLTEMVAGIKGPGLLWDKALRSRRGRRIGSPCRQLARHRLHPRRARRLLGAGMGGHLRRHPHRCGRGRPVACRRVGDAVPVARPAALPEPHRLHHAWRHPGRHPRRRRRHHDDVQGRGAVG